MSKVHKLHLKLAESAKSHYAQEHNYCLSMDRSTNWMTRAELYWFLDKNTNWNTRAQLYWFLEKRTNWNTRNIYVDFNLLKNWKTIFQKTPIFIKLFSSDSIFKKVVCRLSIGAASQIFLNNVPSLPILMGPELASENACWHITASASFIASSFRV